MGAVYPFSAIVAQDEMKLALVIAAIDPSVGGVLVFGDRGTGKSTTVRALAALLPPMKVIVDCPYGCDPAAPADRRCADCRAREAAKPGSHALKSRTVILAKRSKPAAANA